MVGFWRRAARRTTEPWPADRVARGRALSLRAACPLVAREREPGRCPIQIGRLSVRMAYATSCDRVCCCWQKTSKAPSAALGEGRTSGSRRLLARLRRSEALCSSLCLCLRFQTFPNSLCFSNPAGRSLPPPPPILLPSPWCGPHCLPRWPMLLWLQPCERDLLALLACGLQGSETPL